MWFSARSTSPSPVRHNSGFGVHSDDDSSDSASSSDSDSFCYQSESEVPYPPPRPKRVQHSPPEQRYIEETVAAIRLRVRYHDPYEEWERQTRKDAFHAALKEQAALRAAQHASRAPARKQFLARMVARHARQLAEVEQALAAANMRCASEEGRMREAWRRNERGLRERVESGIRYEEEKVRARLEAERRVREEEERKKLEEERRVREVEERKRAAEERKRAEEEKVRRAAEEKKVKEEEERERDKRRESAEKERVASVDEDWRHARETLLKLKSEVMKHVKGDQQLKRTWNALRRQITPKIGQLTADPAVIARISTQLLDILRPTPPHPPPIYHALLSSLSKCILLQAETEVTAEKRSAQPLAQVTASLLGSLDGFAEVLYAKLGQRAGGWVVPCAVPESDVGGRRWGPGERQRAMGYRGGEGSMETPGEYVVRVAGVMRAYFAILGVPVGKPLHPMFQVPRYWVWFARIMGEGGLLETAVAPQLIYVALDVFGLDARAFWGKQWVKMLALLYEGVTVGIGGGRLVGGQSAEGKAGRVRVQLEVERIMSAG